MKCPFCSADRTNKRIKDAVEFSCGMTFSSMFVENLMSWSNKPKTKSDTDEAYKEITSYREHQPDACIRLERDRLLATLHAGVNVLRATRAAGDALACYVAADARGHKARRLVEAWAEVSR